MGSRVSLFLLSVGYTTSPYVKREKRAKDFARFEKVELWGLPTLVLAADAEQAVPDDGPLVSAYCRWASNQAAVRIVRSLMCAGLTKPWPSLG